MRKKKKSKPIFSIELFYFIILGLINVTDNVESKKGVTVTVNQKIFALETSMNR